MSLNGEYFWIVSPLLFLTFALSSVIILWKRRKEGRTAIYFWTIVVITVLAGIFWAILWSSSFPKEPIPVEPVGYKISEVVAGEIIMISREQGSVSFTEDVIVSAIKEVN